MRKSRVDDVSQGVGRNARWTKLPHHPLHARAAARVRWRRATQTAPLSRSLDPACIRFDDPNAVVNGEIVHAEFTAYDFGLEHAVGAWSPARGFAIAFREATPSGDAVPEEANLIYRDVEIPGSAFKGVTATWAHAPATVTLNRSMLPPPETTDPLEQD